MRPRGFSDVSMGAMRRGRSGLDGEPRIDIPRFDMSFEGREGKLTLARPYAFSLGVCERLELEVGALRFPVDTSGGPERFRNRRTRLRSFRFRFERNAMEKKLRDAGLSISFYRGAFAGTIGTAVRDAMGTLAFDVAIRTDGLDLIWLPLSVRAISEGPSTAQARLLALLQARRGDEDVFRYERPIRSICAEMLVRAGFRVPDERGVRWAIALDAAGDFVLESKPSADEERVRSGLEDKECFELLLDAWRHLANGAFDEADRTLRSAEKSFPADRALRELRLSLETARLASTQAALGSTAAYVDENDAADSPTDSHRSSLARACVLFGESLRRGDTPRAVRLARALVDHEPCVRLVVEAAVRAAELARRDGQDSAGLIRAALGRAPDRADLAIWYFGTVRNRSETDEIKRVWSRALYGASADSVRVELTRAAAEACARLTVLDAAEELLERGLRDCPDNPSLLEKSGEIALASSKPALAAERFDAAATRFAVLGERSNAARCLRASGEAYRVLGRKHAALKRLERTLELDPKSVASILALANAHSEEGAVEDAARAFVRLLQLETADGLAAALERGREFFADKMRDEETASSFQSALGRLKANLAAPTDSRPFSNP